MVILDQLTWHILKDAQNVILRKNVTKDWVNRYPGYLVCQLELDVSIQATIILN